MRTDDKVMKPVKPIKNIDDVQRIRKMLKKSPRNLLLFDIATQTGLKLGEALGLKVKDVLEMDDGKISFLSPNALGVKMSREIRYSLRRHVETARLAGEDHLFKSRKGDKPLNASSASSIVNTWFKAAGLKGLSGWASLRKSWETHYRRQELEGLEASSKHSETPTIAKKIYSQLVEAIISAKIQPREKMTTEEVARRMKVSTVSVREAFIRLKEAGFISTTRGKGNVVIPLSKKALEEIANIRLALESLAAKKAVENRTEETLDLLEVTLKDLVQATYRRDADNIVRLNKQFHTTLLRDADSPILLQMINRLLDRVNPYFHLTYREADPNYTTFDVQCHQGMLDGLRARDASMIKKWLKSDLIVAAKRTGKFLTTKRRNK